MHRVMNTPHRSLSENFKIKEKGRSRVLNFYHNNHHQQYPFNCIALEKWGFDLIKELEVV